MGILLRLLFSVTLITSFAINHAMDREESPALSNCQCPEELEMLMDSLTLHSLDKNETSSGELVILMQSMNLHNGEQAKPSILSKLERIAELAKKLNVCLLKDEGYSQEMESMMIEHFPARAADAISESGIPKADLYKPTRELLKTIARHTKNPSADLTLLEQMINCLASFKLKYMIATQYLPDVIEDTTNRYKQAMLCILHS